MTLMSQLARIAIEVSGTWGSGRDDARAGYGGVLASGLERGSTPRADPRALGLVSQPRGDGRRTLAPEHPVHMSDKLVIRNLHKVFGPEPQEAMRLLEKGLSKEEIFKRTRATVGVHDASFTIREGEVFVVMGLSGSGKSTLVRMLNRLIEPTAGQVLLDGEDITAMGKRALIALRRTRMSMVFQSFALLPTRPWPRTPPSGWRSRNGRAERLARVHEALETVGLQASADSYPDELSGGMQQRVGLARALATRAPVLLMDEAFSALDPLIRTEMQDEIVRLQQSQSHTIVFISHDLDKAIRIGDRIAIMDGGAVVQIGTPEEIVANPANEYIRSFFYGVDVSKVFKAGDIAGQGAHGVRAPGGQRARGPRPAPRPSPQLRGGHRARPGLPGHGERQLPGDGHRSARRAPLGRRADGLGPAGGP